MAKNVTIITLLQTIQAVQPDIVLVELCKSRVDILKYDEEFLLREAKNIDLQKLRLAIKHVSTICDAFIDHKNHCTPQCRCAVTGCRFVCNCGAGVEKR